tara:strand:- start:1669 stop:1872 length:204 start_codon:yes stop_codon:yes gene_type:complete
MMIDSKVMLSIIANPILTKLLYQMVYMTKPETVKILLGFVYLQSQKNWKALDLGLKTTAKLFTYIKI